MFYYWAQWKNKPHLLFNVEQKLTRATEYDWVIILFIIRLIFSFSFSIVPHNPLPLLYINIVISYKIQPPNFKVYLSPLANSNAGFLVEQLSPKWWFRVSASSCFVILLFSMGDSQVCRGWQRVGPLHSRLPERDKSIESISCSFYGPGLDVAHITSAHFLWAKLGSVATHNCKEGSVPKRKRRHWSQSWWCFYYFVLSLKASTEHLCNTGWGSWTFSWVFFKPSGSAFASGFLGGNIMMKKVTVM